MLLTALLPPFEVIWASDRVPIGLPSPRFKWYLRRGSDLLFSALLVYGIDAGLEWELVRFRRSERSVWRLFSGQSVLRAL